MTIKEFPATFSEMFAGERWLEWKFDTRNEYLNSAEKDDCKWQKWRNKILYTDFI